MTEKPKVTNSESARELEKLDKQAKAFDENIKELSTQTMNSVLPIEERDVQVKKSQEELRKESGIVLKPERSISSREKFNERFRSEYEFRAEIVCFQCENHEVIGEAIEMWTKPYPGMPAQFWKVPVNKVVWGPRFLAEQISKKTYTRFVMDDKRITGQYAEGQYTGGIVASSSIKRLSATKVNPTRTSLLISNF